MSVKSGTGQEGCGLMIEYLFSIHKTLGQGRGKERRGGERRERKKERVRE